MANPADETAPHGEAKPSMREMANAIRALSMDAVEAANSGHPGMPMGMADVAAVLFAKFLKFDAADPTGQIATASCFRPATARCCSIRCSISRDIRASPSRI